MNDVSNGNPFLNVDEAGGIARGQHRWFQFSIAGLFVLTTAVAVLLAIAELDVEITAALGLSLVAGALAGRRASGSADGQRRGAVFGTLAGLVAYVATLFPRDALHAWNPHGACASLWAAVILGGVAGHISVVTGNWLQRRPRFRRRAMRAGALALALLLLTRLLQKRDELWAVWGDAHGTFNASFRYSLPRNPRFSHLSPEKSPWLLLWQFAGISSTVRLTWFPEEPADEVDLSHLRGLHSLESLNLARAELRGNPIRYFGRLRWLKYVSLAQTSLGDADLAELPPMRSLTSLDLGGTNVTDAGLVHLSGSHKLLILSLRDTSITDTGLGRLERLQLPLTTVTNAPGSRVVLDLIGTQVSEGRMVKFRGDHPGCTVQFEDVRVKVSRPAAKSVASGAATGAP